MASANRFVKAALASLMLSSVLNAPASAQQADALRSGFADPPGSARPRVWWHWMNGNITKEGIAKDLAWMKRVGIGGLQNFDANLATPQIVDQRLVYMTPEWKDAFRFAVNTAEQNGLEFAIAGSPGWSETGGPWVPAQDGIKKLSWSETVIAGGRPFNGKLPAPPRTTGPFQTLTPNDAFADKTEPPTYYSDIAVLAVPAPASRDVAPATVLADASRALNQAVLSDHDFGSAVELPLKNSKAPSLALNYRAAVTVRSATLFVPDAGLFGSSRVAPVLEARVGDAWRHVATFEVGSVPTTLSFAPITASEFRLTVSPDPRPNPIGWAVPNPGVIVPDFLGLNAKPRSVKIAEFRLSQAPAIDRFETKAGYALTENYYSLTTSASPHEKGVDPARVVDLTSRMRPDGSVDWAPPPGEWKILRIGYSLTGKTNHPASPEATGLEVDKLDAAAVRRYLERYLGMYRETVGPELFGGKGLRAFLTDSTEVGGFNWTPAMVEQFRRLRGYELLPWLPALTGTIVGTRAESDKFLYDYRRTLAELHATEHYGTLAKVAHEQGLKVYGEALEDKRPVIGDDMAMRRFADVPMAALWTYQPSRGPRTTLLGDMKGASSVAHLYGQNLAAAESMTSALTPWAHSPADLRPIIDLEFAHGINRAVIHTSVHQPTDEKVPGLSLLIFGQFFNRHETWAEMARPWIDYVSRSSFMLQQGRNVADVAYFYGEEAPLTALFANEPPKDLPTSYAYDFVNADALLNLLQVEGGDLVAPSGARYRALFLSGTSHQMTLPVLRRIAAMANAGATIVGKAPTGSPGLTDDRQEFDRLVSQLWGGGEVTRVGNGRVVASSDIENSLRSLGIQPDFQHDAPAVDGALMFVHRKLEDGDAYFVTNRANRTRQFNGRFRVAGDSPELWHADTGLTEPVSFRIEDGETIVPLELGAGDSVFVMFRQPATAQTLKINKPKLTSVATISGPWNVTFQDGRGAPPAIRLPSLSSLTEQPDPGIKYFSGVASYMATFTLPENVRPGATLWLDLGSVGDIAEVTLNGQTVGTAWHAPYRVDIGKAAKPGANNLEIKVANLWVNRLIGDAQPGARKIAFTTLPMYRADAPLRPAGLIGPVQLLADAPTQSR